MATTARRAFLVWMLMTIALLAPIPASAGGGGCELTDGSGSTVEIEFSCITPTLIRVEPSDTVTFVNRDSYRHVIVGAGYQWASKGYMRAQEAFAATFDEDGVYPYQCYLHPGMSGTVIVGTGTGLGPATSGNVLVEQVSLEEPLPEIVYVTRPPEIRTVVTRANSAGPWTVGILVGLATGVLVALGATTLGRRRSRGALDARKVSG